MLPTVKTPFTGPEPILLIDQRLTDQNVWGRLSHADHAMIIKLTEQFIERVIADGSPEFMVKLGLPSDFKKDHILEKFYWQLAQFYRYSTPSRIADAVPALEFVIDVYKRCNPSGNQIDIFPMLYLGVALSKKPGEEEKAIKTFEDALDNLDKAPQMPVRGLIWARAYFSRTLRRKGRVKGAMKQEKLIREWILGHPYSMPPSELKELVIEDGQRDYVFSHPEMMTVFGQMEEIKDPDTGAAVVIDSRMGVTVTQQR